MLISFKICWLVKRWVSKMLAQNEEIPLKNANSQQFSNLGFSSLNGEYLY